jgi:hypothetical protein
MSRPGAVWYGRRRGRGDVDELTASGHRSAHALRVEAEVDQAVESPEDSLREQVDRHQRASVMMAHEGSSGSGARL